MEKRTLLDWLTPKPSIVHEGWTRGKPRSVKISLILTTSDDGLAVVDVVTPGQSSSRTTLPMTSELGRLLQSFLASVGCPDHR